MSGGPTTESLSGLLRSTLDRAPRRTVGLAVGIRAAGATAVHGLGTAGAGEGPPGGDTLFQIGSVTKVFTALALADAVVRGELSLDTPLAELLPEAPDDRITLGSLATHTSGLPRLPGGLRRAALRSRRDPYRDFDTPRLLDALASARILSEPGTRYRYSNFGFGLLGEALCRRTGLAYEQLITTRVTEPLGLADTVVRLRPEQTERKASGHSRGRPVPDWDMGGLPGAGALYSTVDDQLRLLHGCLHPDDTPLSAALRLVQEPRHRVNGRVQIGLGWHVLRLGRSTTAVWHNGGTGGFRSFVALDPEADAGVVVLSNSTRSVDGLGMRLLQRLT